MKSENAMTAHARRKRIKTWAVRIFAMFLALLLIGGAIYYSLFFLFV